MRIYLYASAYLQRKSLVCYESVYCNICDCWNGVPSVQWKYALRCSLPYCKYDSFEVRLQIINIQTTRDNILLHNALVTRQRRNRQNLNCAILGFCIVILTKVYFLITRPTKQTTIHCKKMLSILLATDLLVSFIFSLSSTAM